MATPDKDQRIIEIILKAQDANASLKEMGAGAAVMAAQLGKMGQDDPGRAKLVADLQLLNGRLATGRAELRGTAQSAEELAEAEAKLAAQQLKVVVDGQKVSATFNEMKASAAQLEKELGDLSHDDPGRAKMLADYKALGLRIEEVKNEMGQAAPKASLFKEALGFAGIVVSTEAVVQGVIGIGKSIFDTTSKFEGYSAIMKNALGSESVAQAALRDIQTLAAKTPFSVDELTASFIKFVNRGLKPSMEDMQKLADLAASQGKSFDQLTEAVLDAATGEFERLKEFGVQASKNGDKVSLSFKDMQKTVANTPEAIQAALLAFGEMDGVAGSTAAMMATLGGITSNIGDSADQAAVQWGGVLLPVFKGVLTTIGVLIGALGAIPAFIVENRGLLLGLAGAVLSLNAANITATASTLAQLAMEKARQVATKASAAAQWLLNVAMEANPIGLVVAAVMLLVGAFVTLYEKSDKVRAIVAGLGSAFMALITSLKNGFVQQIRAIGLILEGALTARPDKIAEGLRNLTSVFTDAGKNAAAAFNQGYDAKMAAEQAKKKDDPAAIAEAKKRAEAAAKARLAAEAAARLEALKHEEADLKVRLASAEDGTRQEMKLKQQLLAVQAKMELEDAKKTEDDKRVIRAEARAKINDLEHDFNEKAAKAAQAARQKAAQAHLDDLKIWVKNEGGVLQTRNALDIARQQAANTDELKQRESQRQKIMEEADKKYQALAELEGNHTLEMQAVVEERDQKLRELENGFKEKDQAERQKALEEKLQQVGADEAEEVARLDNQHALGLLTEQEYQDQLYAIKKKGMDDQLDLLIKAGKGETAEAKKIKADQLKLDTDHIVKEKDLKRQQLDFEQNMAKMGARLLVEGLQVIEDNLDKRSDAYQAFKAARKAAAIAEVGVNLISEIQNNALWASDPKNPLQSIPGATVAEMVIKDGLALVRAASATTKIAAFAQGGRTDQGRNMVPLAGVLSGASGGSFAPGGPVTGPTLGLIGEAGAELVIPNWLYADPKQANLMGFLEAQIASRGNAFATGGTTVGPSPVVATDPTSDVSDQMLALMQQFVRGQQEFRDEISDWQRSLEVNLDPRKAKKAIDVATQVMSGGGIK